MKTLREKLHSQRGASILLALLFLLVCMMVAASVLMAAVSNAGKIRSNYEEQQRYLALSSALRLVAGELERARYQGHYIVEQWNETITAKSEKNEEIELSNIDYYRITQEPGIFICGDLAVNGTPEADAVLTFRKELDGAFAGEFRDTGYVGLGDSNTAPLPTNLPDNTRKLTVTVSGGIENMFPPVEVEIDMSQSLRIHLKATMSTKMKDDGTPDPAGSYIMEAELEARLAEVKADGSMEELPASGLPSISYLPKKRFPKDDIPNSAPELGLTVTKEDPLPETTKEAVTWKLDWISRETKEERG